MGAMTTLGLEMEMPVACGDTGRSSSAGAVFSQLAVRKLARGEPAQLSELSGRIAGVAIPGLTSSLDNAFNNLESSIGPVEDASGGLGLLARIANRELADVVDCLAQDNRVVLNVAEHPDFTPDHAVRAVLRAPKPVYDGWIGHRNWDHDAGLDAKSHNSPSTGVEPANAVAALNVMLALAPALIALYANSPLEAGRLTGLKENRLTLFPRMFAMSRFAADRRLARTPSRPFSDIADHLTWMFGADSAMHAIPAALPGDYKSDPDLAIVSGDPSLMDFLRCGARMARTLSTGETVLVSASARHVEYLQFSSFLDARLRWRWHSVPDLDDFLDAMEVPGGMEALFAAFARDVYIEGRAPGTNFADAELADEIGDAAADALVASPAAIQLGLLRNLCESGEIVRRWGWERLCRMRDAAIADALDAVVDGRSIRDLCADVMAAAERGLRDGERRFLAAPAHALATGRTGADRLIAAWEATPGDAGRRLRAIARRRTVVAPRCAHEPSTVSEGAVAIPLAQ